MYSYVPKEERRIIETDYLTNENEEIENIAENV